MKWAIIGLVAVIVLGGAGYGIYRWTSLPEQAEEWMSEQDLKNFPAQARREVKDMKSNLDEYKNTQRELQKDIIKREGREDWQEADKKDTIIGYDSDIAKREDAIKDIVAQVKKQNSELLSAGTIDLDNNKVPADYQYAIRTPDGRTEKYTEARARQETDKLATEVDRFKKKRERQQRIVDAKKGYVTKLDDAMVRLSKKIEEMEEFIEDMETELELLKIEEDIAAINKSLAGEDDTNRFGASIRKFREKKKEFLAEQELTNNEKPNDDSYFAEKEDTSGGSSASYWN